MEGRKMNGFCNTGSRLLAGCLFLLALHGCTDDDDTGSNPASAVFSISQNWAYPDSLVELDATDAWALSVPADSVEIRWDLDSDGVFDTDWSTDSLLQVSWPEEQLVRVTLEVRNRYDDEDSDWQEISILPLDWHHPPELITVMPGGFQMGLDSLEQVDHWVTLETAYALGKREVSNGEFLSTLNWAWQNLREDEDWQLQINPYNGTLQARGVFLLDTGAEESEIWYSEVEDLFLLRSSSETAAEYAFPDGYNAWLHPVKGVSWYGAAAFCDWLNLMDGGDLLYDSDWNDEYARNPYTFTGWRLPMEAEWEFAARQPDGRPYPWGEERPSCSLTNYRSDLDACIGWSQPVGTYTSGASALGFLDLGGNVREWVQDWGDVYGNGTVVNPLGAETGTDRVIRGGGWSSPYIQVSSAARQGDDPLVTAWDLGFRVAYGNLP